MKKSKNKHEEYLTKAERFAKRELEKFGWKPKKCTLLKIMVK